RAADLLRRAQQTAAESELPEHSAAAASIAELFWTIAVGWARLGDAGQTVESLRSAVRTGWLDAEWMERDPELGIVRGSEEFRELLGKVRRTPKVRFEGSD